MNMNAIIDSQHFVAIKDDRPVTNSLKVAEAFGKMHKDVLKRLQRLECSDEFTERNFALSEYLDSTGRALPMYEMTKDGFMFLVMGFTGAKAAAIKEAYIKAFNVMADLLRDQQTAAEDECLLGSFVGEGVRLDFGRGAVYAEWCDNGSLWLSDLDIDEVLGYKIRNATRTLFFRRQHEFPLDSYEIFEDQGVTSVMFTPRAWAVIARLSTNPRAADLSLAAVQHYVTPGKIEVDREKYKRLASHAREIGEKFQRIVDASVELSSGIEEARDPAQMAQFSIEQMRR